MNLRASHLDEAERPRAATIKFAYPSGSRPLEGYTIKRGVGRGGFGEVYFATSDAGKEVALKLIRRNLEVELRGVTQCLNLKHPNLIGLYDIRSDGSDDQWVIMEYVAGESLEDVIDRHPSGMPIDQVLWWMRGMCAGVAYLHDHGIVHRDLKPGNIFCDEGTVKIGDYGLAKFISCSRRSGQTESVGTVHYMAPEIANGRYGREIDTYALGIILFEMLTGHVPFEGESIGEVLMKHLTAEPDLSVLNQPYRDIVRRALAKDPEVRLKSVGEIVDLLPGSVDTIVLTPIEAPANGVRPGVSPHAPAAKAAFAASPRAVGASGPRQPSRGSARPEEPIWKTVSGGFKKLRQQWHGDEVRQMHPLAKALLVFALVIGFFTFFEVGMRLAFPVLICYGIYYVIWVSFLRPEASSEEILADRAAQYASATGASAEKHSSPWSVGGAAGDAHGDAKTPSAADRYAEQVRRRRLRPSWRERAHHELAAKPLRSKLSELLGSMILAAMFASLAALVAPLLLQEGAPADRLAAHLWLALVGTLGSWAVLVPAKFAEGKLEDQVPLRITMVSLGALVGLAGWLLAGALLLDLPRAGEPINLGVGLLSHQILGWPRTPGGTLPPLPVFIAYFALLFLLLRWWRQAEYTRTVRFSLWSILACMFWAWLLHIFWWFPQPTGIVVAGVISAATQLASPWLPPSRRRALALELEEGVA